jgi:hypothetical protein
MLTVGLVKMLLVIVVCGIFMGLIALRLWDAYRDQIEWRRLLATQPLAPTVYDPSMVKDLPESVRRFFNYAILPGTRLKTVAEISMSGEFGFGNQNRPNYRRMIARQLLASPTGFLWKANMPSVVPVSGSDSGSWTRFRILGLLPVARFGGSADHEKSAFGRYVAEAVFWSPASLLFGPGVRWEVVSTDVIRVTVAHKNMSQSVDITLDHDGRPSIIQFLRWSNANQEKRYRLQPFGGRLSDFREIEGFRVPFYVQAGNMFGTEEEFTFFKAKVDSINYPASQEKGKN